MAHSLGDRMKGYEAVSDGCLMRKTPAVVRVDGKAFHSFTRGCDRPFDYGLRNCMEDAALALCEEIQGAKFAFVQSDEISVLMSDMDSIRTEPWFGYRIQKMASVAASIATAHFGKAWRHIGGSGVPFFDGRVFSLPPDEVVNYFIWRQQDATRNSIQMAARAVFSHKACHGKNQDELQEMLWSEKGVNWNDYPTEFRRGSCVVQQEESFTVPAGPNAGDTVTRKRWQVDMDTPIFSQDRTYIERTFNGIMDTVLSAVFPGRAEP